MTSQFEGPYGTAVQLAVPDRASAVETLDLWLLTAPLSHPFWSQYLLMTLKLTDGLPGWPEPHHQFAGSTHEVLVWALNPERGTHTAESLAPELQSGDLPVMTPQNVVEQFEATDEEMLRLDAEVAAGVTRGNLNPDSDGRSAWLPVLTKTLAHIRGEAHAS